MNDRYEAMYQAATRYYAQGDTMESIAHQLRLSRSSVSRLLKDARESGLVRISIATHTGSQSPLATALADAFDVRVHLVPVTRSPRSPAGSSPRRWTTTSSSGSRGA
jgi:DNA-binding transcriptional regulator LsrR (DeoR family)